MNKLKGSSDAIRIKHLIIFFAVSLLLALPTRTYQLLALVNPENGFFENGDFTVPVLYGLIAVFAILFMVLSFLSKSIPSPKINTGKNPLLAIASLLMAGGFVWDIILIERKIIPQVNSYVSSDVFKNLFTVYLKENGGTFLVLQFIFAVLGVIWSLIFAVSYFEGKPYYKKFPVLALSPLCWCMCGLVSKLTEPISFITVSELLFEIFMLVFAMLFFITFARICTGVFTENSMWGIFGYGLATALLAAIVTIPRLVILFAGLEPVEGNEFSFAHLGIFIFAVAFVLSVIGVGFKHGIKNIQSVSELELPDDEDVVVKGSDVAYVTEVADDEITYTDDVSEENDDYAIDEAVDNYFNEIGANPIVETVEEITEEPVVETVEEVTEEPVIEIVEEVAEEPVIEIVEEVAEEPVVETVEEVTEEPVIETVEEVTEEPVIEIVEGVVEEPVIETVEEITEEPVIETVEEVAEEPVIETVEEVAEEPVIEMVEEITEEPVTETVEEVTEESVENIVSQEPEVSEEFVDFSDMLIDDVDDIDEIVEKTKTERPKKDKYPIKDRYPAKEKKKDEKPKKQKTVSSKNKKQKNVEEETVKIVSLADLKKEKDSE